MQQEKTIFPYFSNIETAIRQISTNAYSISASHTLQGGDIAHTQVHILKNTKHTHNKDYDENKIVSKTYKGTYALAMCEAEALGLQSIAATNSIAVATVRGIITPEPDTAILLLDYTEKQKPRSHFWETFAQNLATMHQYHYLQQKQCSTFGFEKHNYIGENPQSNTPYQSWIAFFTEQRILFQLRLAQEKRNISFANTKKIEQFCAKLPQLLDEPKYPSLLHGDLWSRNYLCTTIEDKHTQEAFLIDPAVYFGHYETDIAMTELFGACDIRFYQSYNAILPLDKGYKERKHIYNVYHLLNHYNLFGTSYLASLMHNIEQFL